MLDVYNCDMDAGVGQIVSFTALFSCLCRSRLSNAPWGKELFMDRVSLVIRGFGSWITKEALDIDVHDPAQFNE